MDAKVEVEPALEDPQQDSGGIRDPPSQPLRRRRAGAAAPLLSCDVGQKTMAACLLDGTTILKWKTWEVGQTAAAFVKSVSFLHADGWLSLPAPRCIIESQPKINQKMRRLAHFMEIFLAMHGLAPRPVSPRLKLRLLPEAELASYYRRKKASVAWADAWMAEHPQSPEIVATWQGAKKKDDLADCLLQASAYLGDA